MTWRAALLPALACAALAGCASLATTIVEPHTQGPLSSRQRAAFDRGFVELGIRGQSLLARDGNRIAYRDVPPADYHLDYRYQRRTDGMKIDVNVANDAPPVAVAERGTIV